MSARKSLLAGIALLSLGSAALASNVTFFQFNADPDGDNGFKEFAYNATTGLTVGPGAVGDGSIFSPGLLGVITGGLSGIPSSPPGLGGGAPYYIASDLTLTLTGFAPTGNAILGSGNISQNLTGGTFTVSYVPTGLVLLTGTTTSATLKETSDGNAGVLSGVVVYTGGVLQAGLAAANLSSIGSFSFAMTGLTGSYGTTTVGVEQHLRSFNADGVGTFDATPIAVPTPAAAFGGAALLGTLAVARSRKQRA